MGFGERIDLLGGGGTSHPLWTSFEGLGRHVAFYLDNVPLNGWVPLGASGGAQAAAGQPQTLRAF